MPITGERHLQRQTIIGYAETARVLDRWMTSHGVDCDFTACDVPMLNRFFATTTPGTARAARSTASGT